MALNLAHFYWNNNGKHQQYLDRLQQLIPSEGAVKNPYKNKALERFRKASNKYYRLYNDGDFNIGASKMFRVEYPSRYKEYYYYNGYRSSKFNQGLYDMVEAAMDEIIKRAAEEQGLE